MDAAHFFLVVMVWTMKFNFETGSVETELGSVNTNHILDCPGMNNELENRTVMQ
jgi:hypothetical protein